MAEFMNRHLPSLRIDEKENIFLEEFPCQSRGLMRIPIPPHKRLQVLFRPQSDARVYAVCDYFPPQPPEIRLKFKQKDDSLVLDEFSTTVIVQKNGSGFAVTYVNFDSCEIRFDFDRCGPAGAGLETKREPFAGLIRQAALSFNQPLVRKLSIPSFIKKIVSKGGGGGE